MLFKVRMENKNYIVATIKNWNIKVYDEVILHYPGNWHLITDPKDLTVENIKSLNPKYIFFPHWSHLVPTEILDVTTCICFHETDLPYGRGGSPLQNLISRGHKNTVISALKMSEEIDAGPIYLKKILSLEGLGEEIYIRASRIIAEMIKTIITENPNPKKQVGKPTVFNRRTPSQSEVPTEINTLASLFDHIRMMDAKSYPKAFIESDGFKYEISRPSLKTEELLADVRITKIVNKNND